jgi:hypothetical protein
MVRAIYPPELKRTYANVGARSACPARRGLRRLRRETRIGGTLPGTGGSGSRVRGLRAEIARTLEPAKALVNRSISRGVGARPGDNYPQHSPRGVGSCALAEQG